MDERVDLQDQFSELFDQCRRLKLGPPSFLKRAAALGVGARAAAAFLGLLAPELAAAQATPKTGGTFTEGYDRDFTKMDPVLSGWADPGYNALYQYVALRDPQGAIVPQLAESWTISPDKLTWTFKIRDGLTFHSGAPCTNANVVEDFKLFADPKVGQNAVFWTPVKNIAAGDGNTVVLTMAHPF